MEEGHTYPFSVVIPLALPLRKHRKRDYHVFLGLEREREGKNCKPRDVMQMEGQMEGRGGKLA